MGARKIFTLEIDLEYAATQEPDEVAEILREAAIMSEAGAEKGKLFDSNGNAVGKFWIKKRRAK